MSRTLRTFNGGKRKKKRRAFGKLKKSGPLKPRRVREVLPPREPEFGVRVAHEWPLYMTEA